LVIIDAHTHFADVGKGSPPNTPDDLVSVMNQNGIDAMITTPPYSSISYERDYDEPNLFIYTAMQKYPKRIFGFARINPHFRERAVTRAENFLKKGFWGIKLHPRNEAVAANDPNLIFPIIEKVEKYNAAVLFHTGQPDTYGFAQPTLCGDVADHFPSVPIIVGHMGKGLFDDAILVAKWFDNIILETSFRTPHNIEKAVQIIGPERIVYGSDFYMGGPTGPELNMLTVKLGDIPDNEKKMILGENINRLLNMGVSSHFGGDQ
jgi:predicted TIM-barrel fold metal-dependent hydrolase